MKPGGSNYTIFFLSKIILISLHYWQFFIVKIQYIILYIYSTLSAPFLPHAPFWNIFYSKSANFNLCQSNRLIDQFDDQSDCADLLDSDLFSDLSFFFFFLSSRLSFQFQSRIGANGKTRVDAELRSKLYRSIVEFTA